MPGAESRQRRRALAPIMALRVAPAAALLLVAVACGSASANDQPNAAAQFATPLPADATGTSPTTVAGAGAAAAAPSTTVWLCRPGVAPDPCLDDRRITDVAANGSTSVEATSPGSSHRFDCFYVYPTVSTETTPNTDRQIQPAEIGSAVLQASQFSQVCDVWAPMYRQITWNGLAHPTAAIIGTAFASVKAAWDDYLAHDNDGRPVVFIGHSQGAIMLIDLLRAEIDHSPALQRRMLSAILLGGNVTVATDQATGGAFTSIPACTSGQQTGCVIAYSSFLEQPPSDSGFGIPGQGAGLLWGQTQRVGQQVLCVNPGALSGGSAAIHPFFLASQEPSMGASTPWVSFPGLYTATCESAGDATWLQVQPSSSSSDHRPRVMESAGPAWGLHADDVNLTLGDLINVVRQEEAAYH